MSNETLSMFIPITKVDQENRLVYGMATAELPDRSGEICDYASTKPFYEKWSEHFAKSTEAMGVEPSLGNLRSMHNKVSSGVLKQLNFDDEAKKIEICAKVTDDAEWKKVLEGNYTGFSQGGGYVKRWADPSTPGLIRYTANPTEVSLVDLPCLAEATFSVIKADGTSEMRKFVNVIQEPPQNPDPAPENLDDVEQVWKATDGTTFKKKADAISHNKMLVEKASAEAVTKAVQEALAPTLDAIKDVANSLERVAGLSKDDAIDTANEYLQLTEEEVTKMADAPAPWIAYLQGMSKRKFSADERKDAVTKGEAMADGSFPIIDAEDLKNAIRIADNAKDPVAAKAHIIKRANEMGLSGTVPDVWKSVEPATGTAVPEPAKEEAPAAVGGTPEVAKGLKGIFLKSRKARADVLKLFGNPHLTEEVKADLTKQNMDALTKHLYDVGRVADLICSLKWLAEDLEWEALWEGDDSTAPDVVKGICSQLCVFLQQLVVEETKELMTGTDSDDIVVLEMAAGTRANALHMLLSSAGGADPLVLKSLEVAMLKGSKADKIHVQAAHDHVAAMMSGDCCSMSKGNTHAHGKLQVAHDVLSGMGATCCDMSDDNAGADDALKAFQDGQLRKGAAFGDELTKAITTQILPTVEALAKRVKAIEDQPLPAKGVVKVFGHSKENDHGQGGSGTIVKGADAILDAVSNLSDEDRQVLMMKMALRNPIARIG